MQLILSFDYELFFGENTGSVQKCIIEPTNLLLDIAKQHAVPMTFFVDVGFLIKLDEYRHANPKLENDWQQILSQLKRMNELNCEAQLHIHPHWEKSTFDGVNWQIQVDGAYKLSDFSDSDAEAIVRKYHSFLTNLVSNQVNAYRAGGWCIQPFSQIESVFQELGICCDSSVFPAGKFSSPHYEFDFTEVPVFSNPYRFQSDVCKKDPTGFFIEVPISSWEYHPLFYWRLYVLGRLNPQAHKMVGDGIFLSQPGRKKSVLTSKTWNHVSCDGYYASMLQKQVSIYAQKKCSCFVIIGHPKSMTRFSFSKLEQFVSQNKVVHSFVQYNSCTL